MLWVLIAVMLFAVATDWWDDLTTVKAIAKGYVESNPLVTVFVGDKPTLAELIAINHSLIAAIFVAGLFILHTPFVAGAIAALIVLGVKHIFGARAGDKLLKE